MDKELLRVVIIATGLLIILGMLVWHFFKNRKFSIDLSLFGRSPIDDEDEDDEQEIKPKKTKRYKETLDDDSGESVNSTDEEDHEPAPRFVAPEIIQFYILAKDGNGFNGFDLYNAFQIVGLEYGSLKIFERLDDHRLVDFGVACLVESGTFPEKNLETFFCPGIVFFMQPAILDDAVAVFDDFVDTIKLLEIELNGEALDHKRQALTDEVIQLIRQSL